MSAYDLEESPWKIEEDQFPREDSVYEQLRFLLSYAALAPSSHNSQPWRFSVEDNRLNIFVDDDRWLRVADADRRELFVSIGCAIENLVIAAERFGLSCKIRYFPDPNDDSHSVAMEFHIAADSGDTELVELFAVMKQRQTNHRQYDSTSLSRQEREALQRSVFEEGTVLCLFDGDEERRHIEALVTRADVLQFADPRWRRELGRYIGEGAFGSSWLMSRVGKLAVTYLNMGKSSARKDANAIESAPLFGVICGDDDEDETRIRCGRVLERMWLRATAMGLAMQPMNQLLQVAEVKEQFVSGLELDGCRPQITFRIGHAEREHKRAPRHSVAELLVDGPEMPTEMPEMPTDVSARAHK